MIHGLSSTGIVSPVRNRLNIPNLTVRQNIGTKTIIATSKSATDIPLVIKAYSGQTSSLFEIRDSTNTVRINITSQSNIPTALCFSNNNANILFKNSSGTNRCLIGRANGDDGNFYFYTYSINKWIFNSTYSGAPTSYTGMVIDCSSAGKHSINLNASTTPDAHFHINGITTSVITSLVRGVASQTASLQEWQNSSSTALASVSAAGLFSSYGAIITAVSSASIPFTIQLAAAQSAHALNVTSSGGSAGDIFAVSATGRIKIGGTTIDSLDRQLNIIATTPGIGFYESDVTTDEKGWDIAAAASVLSLRCFNDAISSANNIFTVSRSGYVPSYMKIYPPLELSTYHFTTYTNNGNSGTSKTIDWTASQVQRVTLTGTCAFTFTAPSGISDILLHITQDGTGGYAATWPASVKWTSGTAPTLTTTAGAVSVLRFFYDGASYWGSYTLDVR